MFKITEEEIKKILPLKGPAFDEVKKYLEKYNNEYIVVKCGGSVLINQNLLKNFIYDISILYKLGLKPIIIHGGGKRISKKLNEFGIIINEMRRVLKKDGLTSHEVDLKDHLNKSLNNLRFSKRIWESKFFSNSGFYTNRIRYSEIIKIFETNGFNVQILRKKMWNKFPIDINSVHKDFRDEPSEEILISSFNLIAS